MSLFVLSKRVFVRVCGLKAVVVIEEEKDELLNVPKGRFHAELFEWVETFLLPAIFVILISAFVARFVVVSGSSMEPTVYDGHSLVASKLFYTPKAGDVVVIINPQDTSMPLIKRIVAVEGQTLDINRETGVISVDGRPLQEPYIQEPNAYVGPLEYPLTIPQGQVFVMGDNRNHSTDSRDLGPIPLHYLVGRVYVRLFPLGEIGVIE